MAHADQRRAPRLPAACRVEIDDRFGAWSAVTEDVGVRGCRIVSSRAPRLGALVQLTLRSERLVAPLRMAGQAVWARDGRIGISFVGPLSGAVSPASWIRELAAVLEDGAAAPRAAGAEPRPAAIRLGTGRERPPPPPLARAGGDGR
jgi:hypothetical protein